MFIIFVIVIYRSSFENNNKLLSLIELTIAFLKMGDQGAFKYT